MSRLKVGLGQIAPRLGQARRQPGQAPSVISDDARAQGVDLLVFPELGLTGYLLQDLNSEVAMRADDPRLRELGARRGEMSRRRRLRRGIRRASAVHRRGAVRGRRAAPRLSQVVPAQLRALRRAALLRGGQPHRRGRLAARAFASASASARTSGICRCPTCWRWTARRC